MKKLIPAYILSFVISFMIWLYEPITMYANNIEDLWFSLDIIIGPLLLVFFLTFAILSGIYSLIYYLNNRFLKKIPIYKIILITSFIGFFALYIQGNYLVYNLPKLDGDIINWSSYKTDSLISGGVWIIIILVTSIFLKLKGYDKVEKGYNYLTLIIFGMLFVSLISTLLTTNVFNNKESIEFTMDNINDASTDKNFFIFVVDAVDSLIFDDVLSKSEYKDTFNDFTYYPDTMSTYPFTRDSIPFILSGIWNENKDEFLTYFNKAMDKSSLIDSLMEKKYNINLYDMEMFWNTNKAKNASNASSKKIHLSKFVFYRQEAKYFIYKYFPYFLKQYSYIETMDFYRCKYRNNYELFFWGNPFIYTYFSDNKINKIDNKNFSFFHLEGGHVPFDMNENLEATSNGTYEQKLGATLKVINLFINRLKENNVYDNSVIIVMADHGYNFDNYIGRQNPILYIKGIDEHHEMYKADLPISYDDLISTYDELLEGKQSTELFKNIDKNRKRRFILYEYMKENHMVEYEQTGKAWDEETLIPTGKEFNG